MAEKHDKQVQQVEEKTDNVVRIVAITALLIALGIKSYSPDAVPDYALIGIISVFAKDIINFFTKGRS